MGFGLHSRNALALGLAGVIGVAAKPGAVATTPTITLISSAVGVNSIAEMPSHQSGDFLVIWGYRDGSSSPPTVPAAWTPAVVASGSNSLGYAVAVKTASSGSETSGTWTGASGLICAVFRPSTGHTISVGGTGTGASTTGITAPIPAVTLTATNGRSRVLGMFAHVSGDLLPVDATTAGLTQITNNPHASDFGAMWITSEVSSWAGATVTFSTGTSGVHRQYAIELMIS